jgi:hypothetical protein
MLSKGVFYTESGKTIGYPKVCFTRKVVKQSTVHYCNALICCGTTLNVPIFTVNFRCTGQIRNVSKSTFFPWLCECEIQP